jgi:hypothetical protein
LEDSEKKDEYTRVGGEWRVSTMRATKYSSCAYFTLHKTKGQKEKQKEEKKNTLVWVFAFCGVCLTCV